MQSVQPSTIEDLEAKRVRAKEAVKVARQLKQSISRQFRDAQSDPQAIENLKRQMQAASLQLASAEAALSEFLHASDSSAVSESVEDSVHFPARMTIRAVNGAVPVDLTFEALGDGNARDWDAYVVANARATLYHDSRWRTIIRGTMGRENLSLLTRQQGRVVGVLPLYRLKSRLFGDFAVSLPYLNYGGPLGDTAEVESALLEEAKRCARRLCLDHMEIRELHRRDGWLARTDKVALIRRLPPTAAALEDDLGSKLRAQIKRGAREGLQFEVGRSAEFVEEFYRVFARNMRDLGTPVYGKQLFLDVLRVFPEEAELLIVRRGAAAVGGAFLLRYRDTLEVPWASTIRSTNSLGSNMFMYWQVLNRAIELQCRFFDFGRSTRDSGTYRFKRQWGAEPMTLHWHYDVEDNGSLPNLRPDNAKYGLLIQLWRKLPVAVANRLGPRLVRSLP